MRTPVLTSIARAQAFAGVWYPSKFEQIKRAITLAMDKNVNNASSVSRVHACKLDTWGLKNEDSE